LLALAAVAKMLSVRPWTLRGALLALIGPIFVYINGGQLLHQVFAYGALEHQKQALFSEVVRTVPSADVVLIDPDIEMQLLDFERRAGHPTFVNWKFAPSNDRELIEWYRRMELRRVLFTQGCLPGTPLPEVRYLLTTLNSAHRLVGSCGTQAAQVGQWVLLRREASSGPRSPSPG
jgi:hypothetical protein